MQHARPRHSKPRSAPRPTRARTTALNHFSYRRTAAPANQDRHDRQDHKKIKGYSVVTPEDKAEGSRSRAAVRRARRRRAEAELPMADVIQMHESVERPEVLIGSTYKIKSPLVEHAHVRDHQRHRPEPGHRARAAPPVRGLHQLQEHGPLPVDRGADPHHERRVPQGRRRHLPGRRDEGRVRPAAAATSRPAACTCRRSSPRSAPWSKST